MNSLCSELRPIPSLVYSTPFRFTYLKSDSTNSPLSPTSSIFSSLLGPHIRIQIACCYFSHLKKMLFNFILSSNYYYYPFFPIPPSNSLLNPLQSDFYFHLTKTTLVNFIKDLCLDDSSGHLSVLIVSDLPEAFDSEYHFLLKIFAVVGLQDSISSWPSSTSLAIIPWALYSFSTLISLGFPGGPRLND